MMEGKLYNDFSKIGYYEPLTEDFLRQIISVEKHGGFWASRYDISKKKLINKIILL